MSKKIFLLLLTIFFVAIAYSQTSANEITGGKIQLSGKLLDAESGYPVSYANIGIGKLGIGTVSNMDGEWTLWIPSSATGEKVTISCLGYTTQNEYVSNLLENKVRKIRQTNYQLGEVVVVPDTLINYILKKAYKDIRINYPSSPTLTQGFYRETQRLSDSLYLYFNEAVLNVYKNTYRNQSNFGQIEVEKSRKNVYPGIDSLNDVRFYGGPHFPNDLDIVFSRWDFIRPSEFKKWNYDLEGMFKDSLSFIYTLRFYNRESPNTNYRGKIYIDANSYAYVGFDLTLAGANTSSSSVTPTNISYIPGNTSIKIGYTEKDGLKYLSYINYKTNGLNTSSKTRVYKDIEYVTTSIKTDSVNPIPYSRQFDYTDILSIEAKDYDQSYWKDYNILKESDMMDKQRNLMYNDDASTVQLTKTYNKELTQEEKLMMFLKRFTFEGGIAYLPFKYIGGSHLIAYGNDPATDADANYRDVKTQSFGIATMDGTRFELNKNFSVFANIATALYGLEQINGDLGINFRTTVFPKGRWVFLDLGLGASVSNWKFPVYTINNINGFYINNREFDSKSVDVKAGTSGTGLKGLLGISVRMGKKYELFADGSYWLPLLFKKDYVQFIEKEGPFMGKKKAKVDWNDPNLYYYINEGSGNFKQVTPRFIAEPYHIRFGIRSGF